MNDFREEVLDVSNYPLKDILLLESSFNKTFSYNDARLIYEKPTLRFQLIQLDMEKYRLMLDTLPISNELNELVFSLINDIGSYGLKGKKRRFVGYNAERKVSNRKAKEQDRGKHYYANDNDFSTKNVEIPLDYENKIICADSLNLLKNLPDNCVDIIFTSPPYNFGLEYDNHNDTASWEKYYDMLFGIFKECIRVLKYGGRCVVNVQPLYSDYIPAHHIISNFFITNKMIWKGEILWEKNNYNCKMCSYGSWKSPASPYLKYTWEFIEVYCKGDLKKSGLSINADITAEEFKSWVVAKWSIAPERHMKEYGHPAMFPENLVERVLKLFSFKGDFVLDPFNGAGTTTAVAKKLNRRYLGIDISQEYCETAQKRIDSINNGQQSLY